MAAPTRKYNPGFLTDDELVASYCVRTTEFELLVEVLQECTGGSNPHQIVIGPRGSGKTSLLLRIAVEVRRNSALASRFFPVVFAEESYEVATAGEFWLESLTNLATQAPRREEAPDLQRTVDELRDIRDDLALADRCLGALLDFADREDKRLVLVVENLNMLFGDMADTDAGWRLRKTLQTEPRIIVFASATSRFDEIDNPDRALYDLFRVRTLRPLDTEQCTVLWQTVSGRNPAPETVRSLEILTGGSPRLIAIVARFAAGLSFRDLMAHLLDLVDDHTEYFKGHLESLPAQERRVYLALAALWKPATTREIAGHARLETSTCSAQLARLGERGVVRVAGGSARRKQYYLTERLYNIYYLLRRRRGPDRLVEALIHFMESYYSPLELKDIGTQLVDDAAGLPPEMRSLHRNALTSLMELSSLAEYRDELLTMMTSGLPAVPGRDSAPADVTGTVDGVQADNDRVERSQTSPDDSAERTAKELFETTARLNDQTRAEDTVSACDEIVRRFGDSGIPGVLIWVAKALVNRGAALSELNQYEETLAACDEVVRRFGESEAPGLLVSVASALVNKGATLGELHRFEEALAAWDEVIHRFGESETLDLFESVASALLNKGAALDTLHRFEEALAAWGEVVRRFGDIEVPAVPELVARALVNRGAALCTLHRPQDALQACDEVVLRFGESEAPGLLESVANALANRVATLGTLNRPQDALETCDEVVRRFGENETPALQKSVATALMNKGAALGMLNRPQDALETCNDVVRRFGTSDSPGLLEPVATALVNRGGALGALNRWQDALETCDEVVRRFGTSDSPGLLRSVATALVNRGGALSALNRPQDALDAWDELIRRFGASEIPAVLERVAQALADKGAFLGALNRPQDAVETCDEMVRRFGESEIPAVLESVAQALLNRASALSALNRPQDELEACDEVVHRFGKSENPALRASVATALVNKGVALAALNRPQETLEACNEVVRRFGASDTPDVVRSVATALVNKAGSLGALNRPREALEACDDVVRRFGKNENPDVLQRVATALANKGAVLGALNRREEAVAAYDEVVRRFGESKTTALQLRVGVALLGAADIEIKSRRYEEAAETATRLVERPTAAPEHRFGGHLIRAKAILAGGAERAGCEHDVEAVLALLPELSPIPNEAILALMDFSIAFGPQRMRELIQASPSADLLLPLTTALERELGLEPRVAREVDEVAQDIRRTLATRRTNRTRQ